jgi:uncharacterized protein (TIGR02466 family)|tara:strand:- start:1077 stop:1799 length:723 start_codon:yes stop_codon:yes gene_type:complete
MKKKEEILHFEAIRPFGPTIIKGKMPDSLVKLMDDKASKMFKDKKYSKEFDHAPHLAGNVKQETRFDPEWMGTQEFLPMVNLIGEMVKSYLSIPPAKETISPEFIGKMVIQSMWAVSQWSGDFNPFHIHEGQLSGVFYLRVPKSLPEEYAKEDHYPTVGDIVWFNGQAATFSGHKFQHSPKVGDIFLFPHWLAHGVYPFRTKNEERRSVSFNLELIKKEDDPNVGNAETTKRKEFYKNKK